MFNILLASVIIAMFVFAVINYKNELHLFYGANLFIAGLDLGFLLSRLSPA